MNPFVSLVMSSYNSYLFLEKTVKSILNQTYRNFEFIIIDDASTDGSALLLEKLSAIDGRIVLVKNKTNVGLTKSLNIGIKKARGEYIARIDADDKSFPHRLQKQVEYLENNSGVFLIGSGALEIDELDSERGLFKPTTNYKLLHKKLPVENQFCHSSIMFRNDKKSFYREKFVYAQDYDFYLNLLSRGEILSNLKEALVEYRINTNAISWTKGAQQLLFAAKARDFYQERLLLGKDSYESFDPNEILTINPQKSTNKQVLLAEIQSHFKLRNFKQVREYCIKYFNRHGLYSKILIYYLFSFFGKKIVEIIGRLLKKFSH